MTWSRSKLSGFQCWVAPSDLTDPQHAGSAPSAKCPVFYIYDCILTHVNANGAVFSYLFALIGDDSLVE